MTWPSSSPLWMYPCFSRPPFVLAGEKQQPPPLGKEGTGSEHQLEGTCGDGVVPKYWFWVVRGCDTIILQLAKHLIVAPRILLWPLKMAGSFSLALLCRISGGG